MPEDDYVWLQRSALLTFEEISRVVDVVTTVTGPDTLKVRLTGGEPLLRRDLDTLVGMLAAKPLRDLAMTTNGVLLADNAQRLHDAGLRRVTVSLDTLRPDRYRTLARRDSLPATLAGIRTAAEVGFTDTKLDTVLIRGVNDDELTDLIDYAATIPAEIRFIEYMDVGGATNWSMDTVVPAAEILDRVRAHYGTVEPLPGRGAAPAARYRLPDGTTFGIVASTTQPFCATCNRTRLTADGILYLCLYALTGTDVRTPLRDGATDADLATLIGDTWQRRDDQGATDRVHLTHRGPLIPAETLRTNPHNEMHTRGG